ncbi:hypothetical protein OU792_18280 [Algoriphagus sp. NF]|uniref:DUF7507 domain-containing protein n=1 Tax=Algoriphagus sp. NF TaxID=2992756 RepID=UPI00237B97BB|nr:hypothetical protein [Algoriphagus sp. NF]MDE0561951.1 hypothetical protein [Algoriphagus sp. NF]
MSEETNKPDEPEIEAFHQVISINNSTPAGNIRPGEVADFSVELTNKSTTEGITDGKLEVQIPFGATVESTGFSFDNAITPSGNSAPSFDPNTGILTWEFGNLPLSSDVGLDLDDVLATLTYSLKATEDCLILFENSCTPDMNVDGVVTGTGAVSQSNLNRDFIIDREPAQDQCSSPTGLTGPIEISYNTDDFQCDIITDFEFCAPKDEVTLAEIEAIYDFPDGYTFYGGTDRTTAVQFDANTPFPGAGTYYAFPFGINVTNAANCYTEFTITVIEAPVAPTAEVTQPTCDVATGTITVTAPLGQGLTYSINGTDYQASTTFAGVNLGTYNVTVKSAAGCESLPAEVTVNPQPETPAAPVLTVPAPACDATSVTITFTAEAGVEYSLTNTFAELIVGGSFDAPVDSNGTVFARTEGTECVVSSPFTVAPAPASPDAPVLTVPAPACDATSVTITFTAEAGVEYSLTNIFAELIVGGSFDAPVDSNGTVFARTEGTECVVSSPFTVAPAPASPDAPVLTVPAPACDATSVTITFTAEAGVEYSLTNTFAELIVGGSFDAPVDSNGTVFARTEGTECVVSSPFTVAPAPASPDAPIGDDQTVCATDPIQTLTATATVQSGATLLWYDAETAENPIAGQPTLNVIGTVTYWAEAVSAQGCASERVPVTLTINDCSLSIVKTGTFNDENGNGRADDGETISYTFLVTNTGNLPLTGVTVTDPLVTVNGGPIDLAVGANSGNTFTATYTIDQDDINAGKVDNTATADSNESDPATDDETTDLPQDASLSIVKTGTFNDENGNGRAQIRMSLIRRPTMRRPIFHNLLTFQFPKKSLETMMFWMVR